MSSRLPLEERLHQFVDELRARGMPVSMVERVDALRAVTLTDLARAGRLHTALSATLVKDADHLPTFDAVFELFFRTPGPITDDAEPLDLEAAVEEVLRDGTAELTRRVAEQAVTAFADFEPGRRVAGVLYESLTVDGLRLDERVDALTVGSGPGGGSGSGGGTGSGGEGDGDAAQVRAHAEALRHEVIAVIRERMVADRGPADVARVLRTPMTADVDLTAASTAQLAAIEATLPTLQRKLATALMRRRRQARGPLDLRATVRRSMATGGVPVTLVERPPSPTKPRLLVLADVSGSVASFAGFGLGLVAALSPLYAQLRAFAFIRETVEVSDVVRGRSSSRDAARALRAALAETPLGTSTDYGRALTTFRASALPDLGHRTTVLVLGDARGNHAPARVEALADLARRAGATYWLNPEPRSLWGSGDSLAPVYAPHCTAMVVCRTVTDLRRFVDRLD